MEAQNRIRRNRRTGLVLGVLIGLTLAFIWGNSLQSGAASGAMSGSLRAWLEQLLHVPVDEFLLRKAAHFSEYALLGAGLSLLLNLLLDRNGRPLARGRRLLDFPALGFFAAAIDETIQIFSGRGSSLLDVWLDTAGCLTGFFLIFLIFCTVRSKRHEK